MAEWVDAAGQEERPPPPPELALYLKIKDWGDPWGAGWMKWPAGLLGRLRLARNVYNAWSAYTSAEDRVAWQGKAQNRAANEIVGIVKGYRYEGDEEPLTRVERWEQWQVTGNG